MTGSSERPLENLGEAGGYNVSYVENVKGMKLKEEKEKSMNTTLY